MAKYRAKIVKSEYGYFEFEADNDELAVDHIDKVTQDYTAEKTVDTFWNFYIERAGTQFLNPVSLETWKEVEL